MEHNTKADYIAKKSAWKAVTLFRILFAWLVIPLIIMIADIIKLKHQTIEFYDNYIIQKSGVIAKSERKSAFMGVVSVSVNQSIRGRIFNYGDISVDAVGKWDINTRGIANPESLKRYLNTRMVTTSGYRNSTIFVA